MPVAAFGKVPAAGDFIRANANVEPIPALESWITAGMESAGERIQGWSEQFLAGAPYAFMFRAPRNAAPGKVAVGVIRPSRDAVGRKFPITICTVIDASSVVAQPHLMPLVLGDFLEQATAAQVDHARNQGELTQAISYVRDVDLSQLGYATQEYQQWVSSTSILSALAAIYGHGGQGTVVHALHTIAEAVAAFRGQENPTTPLSLRLPLGSGGPAAAVFWMDLVRNAARWRATVPTCFWSSDGMSGSLLLQLGDPPTSSLGQLWAPDPDSDHVCDLTSPSSVDPSRFVSRLSPPVAQVATRLDVAVQHLVAAMAQ
jgi:type VI secretion system ImpM family protein